MKQTFNLTGRLRVHVYVKVRDNPKIFCQHVDRWLWISTLNSLRPTKKIMRRLFAGSSTLTSMSSKKMAGFYYSKLLYKLRSCDQRLVSNFWHYARQNIAHAVIDNKYYFCHDVTDRRQVRRGYSPRDSEHPRIKRHIVRPSWRTTRHASCLTLCPSHCFTSQALAVTSCQSSNQTRHEL